MKDRQHCPFIQTSVVVYSRLRAILFCRHVLAVHRNAGLNVEQGEEDLKVSLISDGQILTTN